MPDDNKNPVTLSDVTVAFVAGSTLRYSGPDGLNLWTKTWHFVGIVIPAAMAYTWRLRQRMARRGQDRS